MAGRIISASGHCSGHCLFIKVGGDIDGKGTGIMNGHSLAISTPLAPVNSVLGYLLPSQGLVATASA